MTRVAVGLLVLLAVPAFAPAPFPSRRERAANALDPLQGEWKLVRFSRSLGGKQRLESTSSTTHVLVQGNVWRMMNGMDSEDGVLRFSVDGKQQPARVDFRIAEEGGGTRLFSVGLFRREGDALTLAWIEADAGQRPTSFEDIPAGGYLAVFEKKR